MKVKLVYAVAVSIIATGAVIACHKKEEKKIVVEIDKPKEETKKDIEKAVLDTKNNITTPTTQSPATSAQAPASPVIEAKSEEQKSALSQIADTTGEYALTVLTFSPTSFLAMQSIDFFANTLKNIAEKNADEILLAVDKIDNAKQKAIEVAEEMKNAGYAATKEAYDQTKYAAEKCYEYGKYSYDVCTYLLGDIRNAFK